MGDVEYKQALVLRKEGKYKEGRLLLESAFKKGCELAGYELMIAYRHGGWDLCENNLKDRELHYLLNKQGSLYVCVDEQKVIDSNDPFALFLYYHEHRSSRNTAIRFVRIAAEQGNIFAQTWLGNLIWQTDTERKIGLCYLHKAAEARYVKAIDQLAFVCYEWGKTEEALYWGKKSAEQHYYMKRLSMWFLSLGRFEEYVDELVRAGIIDQTITRVHYTPPLAHKYFTGRAYALKLIDWFDADLEEFYHTVFNGAQVAALCWMWIAKQLCVGKDVARLIEQKVFQTRKTDQGLWLDKDKDENKKQV